MCLEQYFDFAQANLIYQIKIAYSGTNKLRKIDKFGTLYLHAYLSTINSSEYNLFTKHQNIIIISPPPPPSQTDISLTLHFHISLKNPNFDIILLLETIELEFIRIVYGPTMVPKPIQSKLSLPLLASIQCRTMWSMLCYPYMSYTNQRMHLCIVITYCMSLL